MRHNQRVKVMYEECGCQRICGRSKRSDLASARQIMASSSEKVQVDPKASNKKKPPAEGLTALVKTQGRLDSCEDSCASL